MVFAKAVYPPAGATALLAAVDPTICDLGWYLLPIVLLSAVLTLVSSLLVNNIQRRYPLYWWTPADLSKEPGSDIEKLPSRDDSSHVVNSMNENTSQLTTITVTSEAITIPQHLKLAREEELVLEVLRNKMKIGAALCDGST